MNCFDSMLAESFDHLEVVFFHPGDFGTSGDGDGRR
jgi:hypothetical protein